VSNADLIATTGRVIDMRSTAWGHNSSVIDWPKRTLFVWCTPGPKVGDTLLLQGHRGVITTRVVNVEWTANVDDMYKIKVVTND